MDEIDDMNDYDYEDESYDGDGGNEDKDAEEVLSKTELLSRNAAAAGFRPKDARVPNTLEYVKTYADVKGGLGRAIVVVGKDKVGLEPERPEFFTLTVQIHVPATEEAVRSKAWDFCRVDLLRFMHMFDTLDGRVEASVVACASCGMMCADMVDSGRGVVCHDCARRKGMM